MNKSLFQSTFKNLYASVASADNCVTKSSQAEVSLSSKLLVVQGAYGYGKMVLEENASIEGWVNLSGSDLSSILSAAPADGDLKILREDSGLRFRQGRWKALLPVTGENPPTIPEDPNDEEALEIADEVWEGLSTSAEFSASPNSVSNMPELSLIYWGEAGIWGSNRISLIHYPSLCLEGGFVLVPKTAFQNAVRIGRPSKLYSREDSILWKWDNDCVLSSPKIACDQYPLDTLQSVLDRKEENRVQWTGDHSQLKNALERVGSLTERVSLAFHPSKVLLKSIDSSIQLQEVLPGKLEGRPVNVVTSVEELVRFIQTTQSGNLGIEGNLLRYRGEEFDCCCSLIVEE